LGAKYSSPISNHLDLSNQSLVLSLTRRLVNKRGTTVVFTTHDPTSAVSVAGYIVLLQGGQTVATGAVEEVITSANLSVVYNTAVEVHRLNGRLVILGPRV